MIEYGTVARRLLAVCALLLIPGWAPWAAGQGSATEIAVYKTSTCGCCSSWADYLRQQGFTVTAKNVADLDAINRKYGVPPRLASCHVALVDGYVVAGHVPADLIKRMLRERPQIAGITVPGMPNSAPGMDQSPAEPYDVLTFDASGRTRVYARR